MKARRKSAVALAERFDGLLPSDKRVERRMMFGCPCAFANANMFAGVHDGRLFVRLPEAGRVQALGCPGAAAFEPMPGRVMREYVVLPGSMPDAHLASWMADAFRYANALPPKAATVRRRNARAGERR